jgi:cytochrome b6-f complex iron-sulfur subunit
MPGCDDCSRRALLRGLALSAAGVAIAACRGGAGSGGGAGDDAVDPDAGPPIDAPGPAVTMCGANLCIDLTKPGAAKLTTVGGTLIVTAPADRIIVVRQSETAWVALSDICTHAGCGVGFNASLARMTCPCHGSQFTLTGAVARGPATRPLAAYQTMFDSTAQILTIVL